MEGYCKSIKAKKSRLFLNASIRVINELEGLLTKYGKTSLLHSVKKSYLCHDTAAIYIIIRY